MARPPDPSSLERPWVAAYPPGVPPTYRLPTVPLTRFLDDAARDFPGRSALIIAGHAVSYAELRDRVDAVAGVLDDLGVSGGDRVLVALPNELALPVTLFAGWRLGAVVVPVAPDTPAEPLASVVADARPVAVVATQQVLHELVQQRSRPAIAVQVEGDEWPRGGLLTTLRGLPGRLLGRGPTRSIGLDDAEDGAVRLGDALADQAPPALPAAPDPDAPALLLYRPRARDLRGVLASHANLVANAFQARLWVPDIQAGRERVLVADPLHQPLPLTVGLLSSVLSAATIALLDDPDPGTLARAVERDKPTLFATTPLRLAGLLREGEPAKRDLSSLRVCVTGGASLDPQVAADIERRTGGARVREGFGVTEAVPLTHAQPVYGRAVPGSMGLPVTGTVAAVVDPDDLSSLRPPGVPGRLIVHGPQVVSGYWERPEATAASFVDGWLVTDDLATVDEDGLFHHVGRLGEMIDRAGVLVSPRHVEAVLQRHPGVRRAGVVATDEGQLLAAVVARRRTRVTPDVVLAHARTYLDAPAVPDHVTLVEELPMSEVGELARDELRHELTGR